MSGGTLRRGLGPVIVAVMGVSALYSGNTFGIRDRFPPPASFVTGRAPSGPEAGDATGEAGTQLRSQPWWQHVRTFTGNGSATTEAFDVDDRALQWRVGFRCQRGTLAIRPLDAAGRPLRRALAETPCPKEGTGFSIQAGRFGLSVEADGPWEAEVSQQVDVPLVEPPSPDVSAGRAALVASGTFYDMDRHGRGTLGIHRFPDGSLEIRLEDFFVTQNSDLEIDLSDLPAPKTTAEFVRGDAQHIAFLKATVGSMNYRIPPEVDLDRARSVVIWCDPLKLAYTGAALLR